MNKVLIVGYYGFKNCGDDALLESIKVNIDSQDRNIVITALSYNPQETEYLYNIKAVNRFNIMKVIIAIKNNNIVIFGGGTLLQDKTSTRSLFYYLGIIALSRLFKAKIMLYANGFGPINRKYNRIFTKIALNIVDIITTRDIVSRDFIKSIDVKNKNIFVTADEAFTLTKSNLDISYIYGQECIPTDKPLVGISIRNWEDEVFLKSLGEFCNEIIKLYTINILLIPMQYPNDLIISKKLVQLVNNENIFMITGEYTLKEKMKILGNCKINVAMRLHSLIISAIEGVPVLGLVYDPKVEAYTSLLKMDVIGDVRKNINCEHMVKSFENVYNNYDNYKSKITKEAKFLSDKASLNIYYLNKLLK